jgi:MFS family permease
MRMTVSRAERALDALNLFLSDVRYGLGAYLAVYLLERHSWNEASIGIALSASAMAGLLAQTPIGMLVDGLRAKRALVASAAALVTASCLIIPLIPRFWPVLTMQAVSGAAAGVFPPAIAAITLGIVGPAAFARRIGRNEAFNHSGNAACNVVVGASAVFYGPGVVFWLMGAMALASIVAVLAIPAHAIDHDVARGFVRGADPHGAVREASDWRELLGYRPLLLFAACGALFHLANAAMLPLLGQKLSSLVHGQGTTLTAASAIAAQAIMVPIALLAGARADIWGRKPLLLLGFAALSLRGVLYTLSDHPGWLVAVQLLDGVGAGLFGALFPIIVADLTRGTGRFNAAQGAVATAQAIGGVVSTTLAGFVVATFGYDAAFLTLSVIAAAGAVLFWSAMPETRIAAGPVASAVSLQ